MLLSKKVKHMNELQHYGVKGMKWGHRKKYPTSEIRKKYDSAKSEYKSAKKEYNRAYNKAHSYSSRHPVSQWAGGKSQKIADAKWDHAIEKAKTTNEAHLKYRNAKRERNSQIKETHKQINKNSSLGNKIVFNDATRRLAAKYVVDNDMSMADAQSRANKDAVRNTAIILGTLGAVSLGNLYLKNK
jgi:hypothetical protein